MNLDFTPTLLVCFIFICFSILIKLRIIKFKVFNYLYIKFEQNTRAIDKHVLWVFTQLFFTEKAIKIKLMGTKKQMKIQNTQ